MKESLGKLPSPFKWSRSGHLLSVHWWSGVSVACSVCAEQALQAGPNQSSVRLYLFRRYPFRTRVYCNQPDQGVTASQNLTANVGTPPRPTGSWSCEPQHISTSFPLLPLKALLTSVRERILRTLENTNGVLSVCLFKKENRKPWIKMQTYVPFSRECWASTTI